MLPGHLGFRTHLILVGERMHPISTRSLPEPLPGTDSGLKGGKVAFDHGFLPCVRSRGELSPVTPACSPPAGRCRLKTQNTLGISRRRCWASPEDSRTTEHRRACSGDCRWASARAPATASKRSLPRFASGRPHWPATVAAEGETREKINSTHHPSYCSHYG